MSLSRVRSWLLASWGLACAVIGTAEPTRTLMLSGHGPEDAVEWYFFCTGGRRSGEWTKIPVPSCWEQQGFGTYNYGLHHRPGRAGPNPPPLADEQGKYRREFVVPADWQGQAVRIVFEGVMTDAEVSVNGKSAGPVHQGSFYRFHHDISSLVRFGETNQLEVTVSKKSANESVNRAERIGDYWLFGGIFRPVWLEARPPAAIDWAAIDARADGRFAAEIHLTAPAPADATLVGQLFGPDGKPVEPAIVARVPAGSEKVSLAEVFPGAKTWTAETPRLHRVRFTLSLMPGRASGGHAPPPQREGTEGASGGRAPPQQHEVTERFGFRTFEVRKEDGLYLNGTKIILKGVNRHCFRPETGRTLSRAQSYEDARLIKEMNMNAVRMSHYPPDRHFLEACDELGLYVLNELAGWQGFYDAPTGARLIGQIVRRDVNHPSILFWDNGNEGGWNSAVDGEFAKWDLQRRPVLHPWSVFSEIDTDHYEPWDSHVKKSAGPMIYLPTEFLHGLYDGGIGAGLRDYWDVMMRSPTAAGGFFWVFADEGLVRTDQGGRIDNAGNLAPDGIVGPHGEKEGSFFTVREIWSPVRMLPRLNADGRIPRDWDGEVEVVNDHDFVDLRDFRLALWGVNFASAAAGSRTEILPGQVGALEVPPRSRRTGAFWVPGDLGRFDAIRFTVANAAARIIWEKTYAIAGPREVPAAPPGATAQMPEELAKWIGVPRMLALRRHERAFEPLKDSPVPRFAWTKQDDGAWRLDYSVRVDATVDILGISFAPAIAWERKRWLGQGPYRVWRNRLEGGDLDVFELAYNDAKPGESYAYPEFNGYFRDWRWLMLQAGGRRLLVENTSDVPFFGLGQPRDGVDGLLALPDVGLAFLEVIPAMRNKMHHTDQLGPQSLAPHVAREISGTLIFRPDSP